MENIEFINWSDGNGSLPWLTEIFVVPIRDVVPDTFNNSSAFRIKTGKQLKKIIVPPATAYLEVVPENVTTYNVTVGIPFPNRSAALDLFVDKYRGMELLVVGKDRYDIAWIFGDDKKGLRMSEQFSNNSRTVKTIVFSNRISSIGFKRLDNLDIDGLFQGEFSIEFSEEFNT